MGANSGTPGAGNTFGIGLGQAAGAVAGGIFGLIGQNARMRKQHQNQLALMNQQYKNQRQLNLQGHQLQMDMWNKTNYPAQMAMLKEAGLNPALMYGMSGGGGTTTGSQGGGSASGGQAGMLDIGSALSASKLAAEIDLLKSQSDKTRKEGDLVGSQTEETKVNIQNIIETTNNTKLRNILIGVETDIRKIERSYTTQQVETNLAEQESRIRNLDVNTGVTEGMKEALINKAQAEAAGAWLTNTLTEANVNLTREKTHQIQESIKQEWEKITQGWKKLSIEEKNTKIKEFAETIKSEYPSIFQTAGRITDKVSNGIMKFGQWVDKKLGVTTPRTTWSINSMD